ncbi:MAG: epoxyqueuosine reductase QueH [Thermodesulfobacteriota bacterium]|nr:epoxyqueuosine reductase QueH [Thermodesulfobacteriota bacterium]
MNKVLIHICCGPCAIYPVKSLRDEANTVMGYYYRHNIHPYSECLRREETLRVYADNIDLKVIYPDNYDLEAFLQMIAFRESDRCAICYHERLRTTAILAKRGKFDGFTSTLLYSKFQNHDLIRSIGESVGKTHGVSFIYRDFRKGWSDGIETSKKLGMYRQQYCGCIYSEKDRYYKPTRKQS